VPLATRFAVRLGRSTSRARGPAWVEAYSRAAIVTGALWAVGSLTALTVAETLPLRGYLANGARRLLDTATDFDGDGHGLVGEERDEAPFQAAAAKPRSRR
jgi:hypothetical protein